MKHYQRAHSVAVNSLQNSLLYSIGHYTEFVLGSWQCKVFLMSSPTYADVCVHTHTAPPGNAWITSGLQCMCERGFNESIREVLEEKCIFSSIASVCIVLCHTYAPYGGGDEGKLQQAYNLTPW